MIDLMETAEKIFDICRYPHLADGRATERIEEILNSVYQKGKADGLNLLINAFKD